MSESNPNNLSVTVYNADGTYQNLKVAFFHGHTERYKLLL